MDPASETEPIGLCVNSRMDYAAPLTFPDVVLAAMTVAAVGTSSITWSCAIFEAAEQDVAITLKDGAITSSIKPVELVSRELRTGIPVSTLA
jgi:acyl-CoA thioesterase FadM